MGTMLRRKEKYQGGPHNMMPPTSLPNGQEEWDVDWTLSAPPEWGGGKWQFPSTHRQYMPFGFIQKPNKEQN